MKTNDYKRIIPALGNIGFSIFILPEVPIKVPTEAKTATFNFTIFSFLQSCGLCQILEILFLVEFEIL